MKAALIMALLLSGCAARRNAYRACTKGAYTGSVTCGPVESRRDAQKHAAGYQESWVERNRNGQSEVVYRESK